jgi:hypothetical protein
MHSLGKSGQYFYVKASGKYLYSNHCRLKVNGVIDRLLKKTRSHDRSLCPTEMLCYVWESLSSPSALRTEVPYYNLCRSLYGRKIQYKYVCISNSGEWILNLHWKCNPPSWKWWRNGYVTNWRSRGMKLNCWHIGTLVGTSVVRSHDQFCNEPAQIQYKKWVVSTDG